MLARHSRMRAPSQRCGNMPLVLADRDDVEGDDGTGDCEAANIARHRSALPNAILSSDSNKSTSGNASNMSAMPGMSGVSGGKSCGWQTPGIEDISSTRSSFRHISRNLQEYLPSSRSPMIAQSTRFLPPPRNRTRRAETRPAGGWIGHIGHAAQPRYCQQTLHIAPRRHCREGRCTVCDCQSVAPLVHLGVHAHRRQLVPMPGQRPPFVSRASWVGKAAALHVHLQS